MKLDTATLSSDRAPATVCRGTQPGMLVGTCADLASELFRGLVPVAVLFEHDAPMF